MNLDPRGLSGARLIQDDDPQETREWLDALEAVIRHAGPGRAHYLIERLIDQARQAGITIPYSATTPYINTIPAELEPSYPGDLDLERRIRSFVRWNAMAMVVRANRRSTEYGGHIASYASAATLYEVGFNHFFRAPNENFGGDLVFFQGHASPGMYARAFLEGRLTEEQLANFRSEVEGNGLSSYPHPWLMPDFWQFPTVSMGLGPLMAIYQARFMRYLHDRELADTTGRKVWCFCGDGEMDEPESVGALSLAGRERLDNLIFVVNCNLQRLDGPVRGDGKIIQELESLFRGAGWNVIKVIWGSRWDPLLARDTHGLLKKRMEEVVDGEYQTYKAKDGAYVREHFFGRYPELLEMVKDMSDEQIFRLDRGGHDPRKVYAAYERAVKHSGQPTVILAKTIKGYGMGEAGEGRMGAHQQKKLEEKALRQFRDRFEIPIPDDKLLETPFYKPSEDSEVMRYLHERRRALGGYLPQRRRQSSVFLSLPDDKPYDFAFQGTGEREMSTTMIFVRLLAAFMRDRRFGRHVVPIVPDEARTFGMEGLFRQYGIYSHVGQLFEPEDAGQINYYREDKKGQVLEEGICEAGAMADWIAAATAYSNHDLPMVPFYIYYSMFGYQRVGDLCWAAGDMQARGFLVGGTAGRTTLAGEGLQHQDGHNLHFFSAVPNCIAYDPCFGYELAVIIRDGLKRMIGNGENVYYYLTVMNENYPHPPMPEGVEAGILKGMYRIAGGDQAQVQLLGSGTILREVIAAAELLRQDFGIAADVWSVTSFSELHRDGVQAERWNQRHPAEAPKKPYVTECLEKASGPVVAATDYIRSHAEQIRAFVPQRYVTLGTDGYGRSDTRKALRYFFEVDRYAVALAALKALADEGKVEADVVRQAIDRYGIDPEKPFPPTV
ncbi:pyruvate dehydrogenase E1 component [Methylomarinovum tepidoasis]|uniref:Pyruvate dehydrogenase E1 component n=1 Tax=Methylomarinovum tepidoasis TaxID=2840183 RepID=A0AAU9C6B9_9GAMM|nr:pyruvate dehydrogenase (acetyl-transferring), homodimeric type [Methylomarinovum sp. IN45]BCX89082.1 pyruvate dehydrogenase E1 component [Methylomarinovum sp. IN45]